MATPPPTDPPPSSDTTPVAPHHRGAPGEPYRLDGALGYWLNLTFNRLRQRTTEYLLSKGVNISPEAWALMVRLWEEDDRSQTELADASFRDRASVTRMIDILEREGYVTRAPDAADRRRHRILLTDEGRALEHTLVPEIIQFLDFAYEGVPVETQIEMRDALQVIYQNLERPLP